MLASTIYYQSTLVFLRLRALHNYVQYACGDQIFGDMWKTPQIGSVQCIRDGGLAGEELNLFFFTGLWYDAAAWDWNLEAGRMQQQQIRWHFTFFFLLLFSNKKKSLLFPKKKKKEKKAPNNKSPTMYSEITLTDKSCCCFF